MTKNTNLAIKANAKENLIALATRCKFFASRGPDANKNKEPVGSLPIMLNRIGESPVVIAALEKVIKEVYRDD